jgi:hypothetical protein
VTEENRSETVKDDASSWADPGALGFAPLAGINLVFAGVFFGWWGGEAFVPHVAVIGFVGGVCQLVAGVVGLKRRDAAGGTMMAAFGTMFMWGPGTMLVMKHVGIAGALDPLFGAWNLFLGFLLGLWSIALVHEPWFEFLVGPYGGLTLASGGLHHLVGLNGILVGSLFVGMFFWGTYMLVHCLGKASGIHFPLGRPASEILGIEGNGADASLSVSGD